MTVSYTEDTRTWSGRYYCDYSQPCVYYDLSLYSSLANVPDESKLFALTDEQWAARLNGQEVLSRAIVDGTWQAYTPPAPSLKEQAGVALSSARSYVSDNFTILNESTPDVWVTYLKALMVIASGADTTSTALPTLPTNSTDYTLTGASTGIVGTTLTLTVTPNNSGAEAATTVTLTDGDAGGTFSPASVALPEWDATAQTVTYTPKAAGTVTISATNSGSLTNPASLSVVVSVAG